MKILLEFVLKPMGICIAAIVGVAAVIVLTMTKTDFIIMLRARYAYFCVAIKFLFGLIKIKTEVKIEYEPLGGLKVSLRRGGGEYKLKSRIGEREKKKKKFTKELQSLLLKCVTVEKIDLAGEVGFAGDAFYSVMAAGAASIIMENFFSVLIDIKMNKGKQYEQHVNVFPSMGRTALNLNLEGIAKINQLKLIYGTAKLILNGAAGKGSNPDLG